MQEKNETEKTTKIKVNFDTNNAKDKISNLFIKNDASDYLTNNLNATMKHLQKTCSSEILSITKNEKLTVEHFNKIIETVIKAKYQEIEL